MIWTMKLLNELIEIEDAIDAYANGFYDTHDLESIEKNLDIYKDKIEMYTPYLPDKDYGFFHYEVIDGKLVMKNNHF